MELADQSIMSAEVAWPALDMLRLGSLTLLHRQQGIGGSDANIILSGDQDKLLRLWREKRGEAQPEDLSQLLPVMLGCWTEAFNRQWFEVQTGTAISTSDCSVVCRDYPWRRCTLDGRVDGAVWEAKHTSAFAKPEDVLDRYMPQLQHNMAVARLDRAILSVLFGNHRYEVFEVSSDWLYQQDLLTAEQAFWDSVKSGREPVAVPPPPSPKPIGVREVCLQGNNAWGALAADWLQFREAAKRHAGACAGLKELVEPDVARAFGHGIEIRRSKSGALSIRELAA